MRDTGEFTDQYGDAVDGSYVAEAVAGFFDNGGERCYVVRIAGADDVAQAGLPDADGNPNLTISAVGPGTWGTNVAVTVADSASGRADEFTLTVRYWTELNDRTGASGQDAVPASDPTVEETFAALSTAAGGPTPLETRVNGVSTLVELERAGGDRPGRPANGTRFLDGPATDPSPTLADYEGDRSDGERSGLAALAAIDDVSIVCAPDTADVSGLADALASHCADLGDRFAVLDPPRDAGPVGSLRPPVDSRYAAFYYPWIVVSGSTPEGSTGAVPPSGHLAGRCVATSRRSGTRSKSSGPTGA